MALTITPTLQVNIESCSNFVCVANFSLIFIQTGPSAVPMSYDMK